MQRAAIVNPTLTGEERRAKNRIFNLARFSSQIFDAPVIPNIPFRENMLAAWREWIKNDVYGRHTYNFNVLTQRVHDAMLTKLRNRLADVLGDQTLTEDVAHRIATSADGIQIAGAINIATTGQFTAQSQAHVRYWIRDYYARTQTQVDQIAELSDPTSNFEIIRLKDNNNYHNMVMNWAFVVQTEANFTNYSTMVSKLITDLNLEATRHNNTFNILNFQVLMYRYRYQSYVEVSPDVLATHAAIAVSPFFTAHTRLTAWIATLVNWFQTVFYTNVPPENIDIEQINWLMPSYPRGDALHQMILELMGDGQQEYSYALILTMNTTILRGGRPGPLAGPTASKGKGSIIERIHQRTSEGTGLRTYPGRLHVAPDRFR